MICVPLDRNMKARLMHRARALMRADVEGRHYGAVTAKAYAVYAALLMSFHNNDSGRCFPSYERIQEAAGCCRQTVAMSLAALEEAGLLMVCNRLLRVRWKDEKAMTTRVRVVRTSNCYSFPSTQAASAEPSKSKFPPATGAAGKGGSSPRTGRQRPFLSSGQAMKPAAPKGRHGALWGDLEARSFRAAGAGADADWAWRGRARRLTLEPRGRETRTYARHLSARAPARGLARACQSLGVPRRRAPKG
jgi:hypothetical protein